MSTISHHITAFSIDDYLTESAKSLSAAERRAVAAVDKKIGELNTLAGRFTTKRMNQRHSLDESIEALEAQLSENPSEQIALEIHSLITRRELAELSHPTINSSLGRARETTIDTLTPLAVNLIDSAEAAFTQAADKHRAANADSHFAADLASFNARATATAAAFAEKKRWIVEEGAAGHFLLAELGIS